MEEDPLIDVELGGRSVSRSRAAKCALGGSVAVSFLLALCIFGRLRHLVEVTEETLRPIRLHFSQDKIWLHGDLAASVLEKQSPNRDALVNVSNLSKDQKAMLQETVHWPPAKLLNQGKDCWQPCGNVSGDCDWCGQGNACCRFNAQFDPEECRGVSFSVTDRHTCVTPVAYHPLKHQRQGCWSHCKRSGYCNWCGAGNSCCMKSATSLDAPECAGAFGFRTQNTYECVATLGQCGLLEEPDGAGGCRKPQKPKGLTFYMYRATNGHLTSFPVNRSVNMGSLTGTMWYLHNNVVTHCPRKFGIDRIRRYLVTLKPTESHFRDTGKIFDRYVEFFDAKVTDPESLEHFSKYGYNPGCMHVDAEAKQAAYAQPIWYSLPGTCPSMDLWSRTGECISRERGGLCEHPDGTSTCTWKAQYAGEIFLDELVDILDHVSFCSGGHLEYDLESDGGIGNDFWNQKLNVAACKSRVDRAYRLFATKYPQLPASMERKPCDV